MARERYVEALRGVEHDVLRMGAVAGEMVRLATHAAVKDDRSLVESVLEMDEDVDGLEAAVTDRVLLLILREAPVARDLLLLTSTLAIVGELEKVGDDACKLARRAGKLSAPFPSEMRRELLAMSRQARANLAAAVRLYVDYDPTAARAVVDADNSVDVAYREARDAIHATVKERPDDVDRLIRLSEVFHALEHVSDRSSEIAKRLRTVHERIGP
ncbi:MAG: phosphate signaling complex PhoU family protein [Fimbriimonas sp.]